MQLCEAISINLSDERLLSIQVPVLGQGLSLSFRLVACNVGMCAKGFYILSRGAPSLLRVYSLISRISPLLIKNLSDEFRLSIRFLVKFGIYPELLFVMIYNQFILVYEIVKVLIFISKGA